MIRLFKHYIVPLFSLHLLLILMLTPSCVQDEISSDPAYKLAFSVDTLSFDTVFTTIGNSNKRIMVYNNNKKTIRISHAGLAKGQNSPFQINFDGQTSPEHQFNDIEIRAKDSLYIFVGVKVDEVATNSAFLIEDNLIFETNGNTQQVALEVYGQNAEFLKGKVILNDTLLTAVKPYVIYDSLVIAEGTTARLAPGSKFYFHKDASLLVYGNLQAEGTFQDPILMRGDRLDVVQQSDTPTVYNHIANQWDGVYLMSKSEKHLFKHVNMNSGYNGIALINTETEGIPAPETVPYVEIVNCRIHNFLSYGLYVENADATVVNTEISNTGNANVYLQGGKHTFVHTTIANYFNIGRQAEQASGRKSAAFKIMNLEKVTPMKTTILNSVIAGSYEDEFTFATQFPAWYDGAFENTYIKKKEKIEEPLFENIRWSEKKDTVFVNTTFEKNLYYNFRPDSVSPLRGLASPDVLLLPEYVKYNLQYDLLGNDRTQDGQPDAGAYEWMPALPEE